MGVTVATLLAWKAARLAHGRALTLPALRESASMRKQETTCVVTIIITVMKMRRTGYTAVWSAGPTLKKTLRARKIIRKERTRACYVTIRVEKQRVV